MFGEARPSAALLAQAVVHRRTPFTIRLTDRLREESRVQPVVLKLDPGSRTTGIAVVRVELVEPVEPRGQGEAEVHHALHLGELTHRGEAIHRAMGKRARYRRRRRSANLRYRAPRFANRRRAKGWLPPSLRSRVEQVLTWARRYQRWTPLARLEVEQVRFDLQLMQYPEITGVAYQRGELAGWEVRSYLLEKFARRCVYCGKPNVPFEVEHVRPRSRGGTDRVSNLVLSCHACNQTKGNQTAAEFGHPDVEKQAKAPLRDAAAINTMRVAVIERLRELGLPIGTWSGGRTRWNRARFQVEKTHALDALCVGNLAGVTPCRGPVLAIEATGRGSHCRTNVDGSGFPRGYRTRQKRIRGFSTGDLVRAVPPPALKTAGMHVGRVAVRASGSFGVGTVDGINAKYCRVLQRADGYAYGRVAAAEAEAAPATTKERLLPSHL